MTRSLCLSFLLLAALMLAGAQAVPPPAKPLANKDIPRPTIDVPKAVKTPLVTAAADDPAWKTAAVIPSLGLAFSPTAGAVAQPTEVRLLWDPEYFYVRFTCKADRIYLPHPGAARDSDFWQGDVAEVYFDIKGDGRQWVELEISPDNCILDQLTVLSCDVKSDDNLVLLPEIQSRDMWQQRYNWTLDGLRTATMTQYTNGAISGWIVDAAIPAEQSMKRLGTHEWAPMTFRANFLRYAWPVDPADPTQRLFTSMNWSPILNWNPHVSPEALGYVHLVAPTPPEPPVIPPTLPLPTPTPAG